MEELRELNAQTADVLLVVPNPDTLLASEPEADMGSAVLDVRDVSSRIPVAEQSRLVCAFEWENPAPEGEMMSQDWNETLQLF